MGEVALKIYCSVCGGVLGHVYMKNREDLAVELESKRVVMKLMTPALSLILIINIVKSMVDH